MRRASAVCAVLAIFLVAAGSTMAGGRPDKDWKRWFGNFAIGAVLPEGEYGDFVEDDLYLKGGAMLWPDTWAAGLEFAASWHQSDFKNSVIDFINDQQPPGAGTIDGGDVEVWSLMTNVVWGPKMGSKVGFYVTAGVGIDFIEARVTTTGLVAYPPICGWYWCVPGGVAPGTIVKGKESTEEFSYNAGIGIDFELGSSTQLYIEATYHSADTDVASTDYIPLVLGVRF